MTHTTRGPLALTVGLRRVVRAAAEAARACLFHEPARLLEGGAELVERRFDDALQTLEVLQVPGDGGVLVRLRGALSSSRSSHPDPSIGLAKSPSPRDRDF